MPPRKFEDILNELVATHPTDEAKRLAWQELDKREAIKMKQCEAIGNMQKEANKSAQGLRAAVKTLLAREMSIEEVAAALKVSKRKIVDTITYYDMEDFVQPGLKKQKWREATGNGKRKTGEQEMYELYIKEQARYQCHKLRSSGWHISLDDVEAMAHEVLVTSLKSYEKLDQKDATFMTYYRRCLKNRIADWVRRAARDSKLFAEFDDTLGYNTNYPRPADGGKYVAGR